MKNGHNKICLNMIVRNESHVIRRCLESVKPYIDAYVICDTGSTDGTQTIIREVMGEIPGEVHERPWVDFGSNRTEALHLARAHGDYLLFIDADEVLCGTGGPLGKLEADAYYLPVEYSGTSYQRCALVSTRLDWMWKGVLHEYLESNPAAIFGNLTEPKIVVYHEGARSRDPDTYKKDVALLEQGVRDEPQNARYWFYLAQSYKDAGDLHKAREAYAHRAAMLGWVEETWYAMFQYANLSDQLNSMEAPTAYLRAYQYLPTRAETLHNLGRYHRLKNEGHLAYLYLHQAARIKKPATGLFIDNSVYDWRCWDELGITCYYINRIDEGKTACLKALAHAPQVEQERIRTNYRFFK